MSRSYKKHCGSAYVGHRSDKYWRKEWHGAIRTRERDMLILQMKHLENDYSYPVPREVGDLWDAPSDGGSQWMYSGFGEYYFEETHPHWPWTIGTVPTREEAWKEWVAMMIGK
ncbi:hypothetical protein AGMMS49942_13900 [Spirochaetia bacterium]|nr:hypothetical protein AGMMS49942_13900 [Spirochaetia bacterium]